MDLSGTRIETQRLLLIPTEERHAEFILKEFTPRVTELMYPKPYEDLSEVGCFIAESRRGLEAGTNLHMVILRRPGGEFLGCAGLHDIGSGCPEFGVWLTETAQGNGFGFEAVSGLRNWADEHLQCEAYVYPVDVRNKASRRIASRLGGRTIGRSNVKNLSGRMLHLVTYAISARRSRRK